VPRERYAEIVSAGAREVSGGELARALARSGLRIAARLRPERLDPALRKRWERTFPGHAELATVLLSKWSQEHRYYHDRVHLLAVLEALDSLCGTQISGQDRLILELAAWFHDAVYEGQSTDEQDSAQLAGQCLQGLLPEHTVASIQRLIMLTSTHQPQAEDRLGALLCDADLEVLARPAPAYQRYTQAVRAEYAQVPLTDFARGRSKILRDLLDKDQLFGTAQARQRWESAARSNLAAELEQLSTQF
jgi:predicted metal-dependent HD superfamily phosphohydrolase